KKRALAVLSSKREMQREGKGEAAVQEIGSEQQGSAARGDQEYILATRLFSIFRIRMWYLRRMLKDLFAYAEVEDIYIIVFKT
ncbi:hypothetical protein ACJX0J_029356, partial [Zea mays]